MHGLARSLLGVAVLTVSALAHPLSGQKAAARAVLRPPVFAMGRSVGSPTAGHLLGGSRLGDAPYLRIAPAYGHGDVRWGLGSLVGMVDRAAQRVNKAFPGSVLNVGHLSRPGGGEVDRHVSHESGRDADLGFYVKNAQGKSILSDHFVPFRGDGTAPSWPGAVFDDARNWALVKALLTDGQARVSHIFVAAPLKARLLAYASRTGVTPELRDRASLAMIQPKGALPHDDHFHVRIACPEWQRECVETPMKRRPAPVAKVPVAHGRVRNGTAALSRPAERSGRAEPHSDAAGVDATERRAPSRVAVPTARMSRPLEAGAARKSDAPTLVEGAKALLFDREVLPVEGKGSEERSTGEKNDAVDPIDDVDGPM